VVVGVVLVIVAPVFAPPAEQKAQQRSVEAFDLGQDVAVIGKLGHPLGKMVTIEGRSAKGAVLRDRGVEDETILFVEKVDGERVRDGVWLRLRPFWSGHQQEVRAGKKCTLRGFETGGFTGSPSGAMKEFGTAFATYGWHFMVWIEYVKVVSEVEDDLKKPYPVPRDGP